MTKPKMVQSKIDTLNMRLAKIVEEYNITLYDLQELDEDRKSDYHRIEDILYEATELMDERDLKVLKAFKDLYGKNIEVGGNRYKVYDISIIRVHEDKGLRTYTFEYGISVPNGQKFDRVYTCVTKSLLEYTDDRGILKDNIIDKIIERHTIEDKKN